MRLKIAYDPKQSVMGNQSFSPSAGKPEKLMSEIIERRVPYETLPFEPLSKAVLSQTHDPKYINGVLAGKINNGFGNSSLEVAEALRYTIGSFYAAAFEALKTKKPVLSPTSGFHHAHFDHGGGFCTFNGLIIASQALLKIGGVEKVGIVDLDQHYGDGTASLIKRHGLSGKIDHYTFGAHSVTPRNANDWLKGLPDKLSRMKDAAVWLVQLGADPYINDPLGGVLTMEQLYERDLIVFRLAKEFDIGVAWNLAGGYTKNFAEVLEIHMNSIKACFEINKKQGSKL